MNGLCDGAERWLVMRLRRRFILGNGYEGVRSAILGVSSGALMVLVESVDCVPLGRDSSNVIGADSVLTACGILFSGEDLTAAVLSGDVETFFDCCCF